MAPLYVVVCIIGVQEYSSMMNARGVPIRKRSIWVAGVLSLPASLPASYNGLFFEMQPLIDGVSWREAMLGLFALYLIGLEVIKPNENSMQAVIYSLFGYVYVPWLLGYAITLRYTPDGVLGLWYMTIPILAIVASDIGAYVFGRFFGRQQLAPRLSPNKTIEGSLGGLLFAIVVVASTTTILRQFFNLYVDIYDTVLFAVLVASSAQLGDLFESMMKRWAGVKDSGTLMPGHGGLLDRIDSSLFALPITYYFVAFVIMR